MKIDNCITNLLGVKFPVIQAGMVWVSGWKLASAVSNCGGLGLIGAGSMKPDLLREHIIKCKAATIKPFGVNLPLLRGDIPDLIKVILEEEVKIVFSSAGHPGKYMDVFKKHDIKVVHVVPSLKLGLKAENAGCDAVVGEGVEAGGHNGIDEISVFTLIPMLTDNLKIPVIAAGGIADGRGILASFSLGAQGVQIGTRFAVTEESSAHPNYKRRVCDADENETVLILKKIGPVRTLRNDFTSKVIDAELNGADVEMLKNLLAVKRERMGIFEGNEAEGLMEAGQGAGLIKDIPSVKVLFDRLLNEYDAAVRSLL